MQGILRKLKVTATKEGLALYSLPLMDKEISLNPYLGEKISLQFTGKISCVHCGKAIPKSFAQGYCYPCFRRIPETDLCLMKPETCHYDKGTCRDPAWGLKNCFIQHTVYLANSSGLKVGITRSHHEETRWLDQGAMQALPLVRVKKRLDAGLIEAILRHHVSDRTNWRLLLKQDADAMDLLSKREEFLSYLPDDFMFDTLQDESVRTYKYPVLQYPKKITTFDFLKTPKIEGVLLGIKGQYLIFEEGVLNIRKFGGFTIDFEASTKRDETLLEMQSHL